jgi:hypothetical protein
MSQAAAPDFPLDFPVDFPVEIFFFQFFSLFLSQIRFFLHSWPFLTRNLARNVFLPKIVFSISQPELKKKIWLLNGG